MSASDSQTTDQLDFVTINGLLAYGEALTQRLSSGQFVLPPPPPPSTDRRQRAEEATGRIRSFIQVTQAGLPDAEAYRAARQELIADACHNDPLVFFAAWNWLLARGELAPLYRAPIGATPKPTHRRPVAIVPRAHLTPQLAEGRIVLDLGDDRFWLLPRDLGDRTLFLTMRHGVSEVESKTHRVGRRLANVLDIERGVPRAEAVGAALARMVGVVGQQLGYLQLRNYLDPRTFLHLISHSPNTEQLCRRITKALIPDRADAVHPHVEPTLESQDFGWATGMEKQAEVEAAAQAFGVDAKTAKRLIKHPFYSYPGGHSFFDLYIDVIDGLHRLGRSHPGEVLCLYTHSSTLRALRIYLDPRPFREAFSEFGEYKEGQDNVVLLTLENGKLSGYSTAVGLIESERVAREAWVTVERERSQRVTLKPQRIKRLLALVSGGDFAGGGAALKELRVTGNRFGLDVFFVRHGFLGLANNWIDTVTEEDTRGMSSHASSPIGSSRFEDFKDEQVQRAAMRSLAPYLEDSALVVLGGDGSLRGARAIHETYGVQVVGIPGTIDNNIAGTTSLGFHSAIALANQSIESLKATSAAMGSIFFVEVMGAGSGHLALASAYQARAEGILVNEHPDPDAYIEEIVLGTLKRTLGVPNKSHIFVVAERTPHRHHREGGVHGLVEYVANTIAAWPQRRETAGYYSLASATKATILGHTLRGAPPTPEDKMIAQHLAYETVRRLVEQPDTIVGCMVAYHDSNRLETIPLHAVSPKPFDWELFTRMHGTEMTHDSI
ncbi:MAG: 6-phosphofructokinase [Nitrospira sp.]|nr:6-phosphofructokinase [Nitrospira sp.]